MLELAQGVLMEDTENICVKMVLESNVDGNEPDRTAVVPVLVNSIADVVEAETTSSSSPESLATWCKSLYCLKA